MDSFNFEKLIVPDWPVTFHKSEIHGIGLFTSRPVKKGETLFICGGIVVTLQQAQAIQTLFQKEFYDMNSPIELIPGYFTCPLPKWLLNRYWDEKDIQAKLFPYIYVNHGCEPTAEVIEAVRMVAIRDLAQDEEITIDYMDSDGFEQTMLCECKAHEKVRLIEG